jgi:hypothetical protein
MTLVPEGWKWSLDSDSDCHIWKGDISEYGVGYTPALALCIAALKAKP